MENEALEGEALPSEEPPVLPSEVTMFPEEMEAEALPMMMSEEPAVLSEVTAEAEPLAPAPELSEEQRAGDVEAPPQQPRTSINAPQGPLGLIFDLASTVVAKVRETSPLYDRVKVGWTLVAINGEDVSHLDGSRVTKLLKMNSHNPQGRRLEFKTPKKVNAEPPAPTSELSEE